jgi:23S rRNA (guanine745-N1)-methyltransferase
VLRCVAGHSFDLAAEGYVNLLLAQHRRSGDPGYSRKMIAGRREFFATGHYNQLADGLANLVAFYMLRTYSQVALDAGCGEGFYLRRIRANLSAQQPERTPVLAGVDISKHGIRIAAKADPPGLYAVASTYRMPVLRKQVDLLLTHFSPVTPHAFRRVVRPDGVVLIGGLGDGHLFSLKEHLYRTPVAHQASAPLTRNQGFELISTHRIRYGIDLAGPAQISSLLLMTPYFWPASQEAQARLGAMEELRTEVDVLVHAYRRTGSGDDTLQLTPSVSTLLDHTGRWPHRIPADGRCWTPGSTQVGLVPWRERDQAGIGSGSEKPVIVADQAI